MKNNQNYSQKKKNLLEVLTSNNLLKDKRLYKAFMEVPLEEFIPEMYRDSFKIYEDIPNLFYYQNPNNYRTISAPHMITIMLQGLSLENNDDLLILGAKSGYIAALAHKLALNGEIIILEANSEIAKLTEENLIKLNLNDNITVIVKNPLEGMPKLSPWQKILVTGAIKQSSIFPLLRQLDPHEGVLYAPIGEEIIQTYTQILRLNSNFFGKKQLQVRFTQLMTQVELDEIELITNLEEYKEVDIEINPKKVDNALDKINIKYETNIFDEINIDEDYGLFDLKQRDNAIKSLNKFKLIINEVKIEENIDLLFKCIKNMEIELKNLEGFKKELGIKTKKIQNILDQINDLNIARRHIEKNSKIDSEIIDRKVDVINKQIEELDNLENLIILEIKRLQNL